MYCADGDLVAVSAAKVAFCDDRSMNIHRTRALPERASHSRRRLADGCGGDGRCRHEEYSQRNFWRPEAYGLVLCGTWETHFRLTFFRMNKRLPSLRWSTAWLLGRSWMHRDFIEYFERVVLRMLEASAAPPNETAGPGGLVYGADGAPPIIPGPFRSDGFVYCLYVHECRPEGFEFE